MKVIRLGSTGSSVTRWQYFLRGQEFQIDATGTFDPATDTATRQFQTLAGLKADGVVGNQTLTRAGSLSFELVNDAAEPDSGYPARPNFASLGPAAAQTKFGPLEYSPAAPGQSLEQIQITNNFEAANLIFVNVPELVGVNGSRDDGKVQIHTAASAAFVALWKSWATAGVLGQVLTFHGVFNPRFVKSEAKERRLSNHAFAVAFDINAKWNALGVEPARRGMKGCLYDLVPIANQHKFFWGGHYKNRRDGMHFEYVG